jgi:hypothetical protein
VRSITIDVPSSVTICYDFRRARRVPCAPSTSSWAGRVTVPEPFRLSNSTTQKNIHRRKCMHEIEATKLQKEADEELTLTRTFKGKSLVRTRHSTESVLFTMQPLLCPLMFICRCTNNYEKNNENVANNCIT